MCNSNDSLDTSVCQVLLWPCAVVDRTVPALKNLCPENTLKLREILSDYVPALKRMKAVERKPAGRVSEKPV